MPQFHSDVHIRHGGNGGMGCEEKEEKMGCRSGRLVNLRVTTRPGWSYRSPRVAALGAVGFRRPLTGCCRVMLSIRLESTVYDLQCPFTGIRTEIGRSQCIRHHHWATGGVLVCAENKRQSSHIQAMYCFRNCRINCRIWSELGTGEQSGSRMPNSRVKRRSRS